MRLQVRFALIAGVITTAISLSIGFFAIATAFNSEVLRADDVINGVVKQLDGKDPLSSAVFLADESDSPLVVALIDTSNELIAVRSTLDEDLNAFSANEAKTAAQEIRTLGEKNKYRVRTISLPQSSYLVLALPIQEIYENRTINFERLGFFLILALLVAFGLTRIFTRPDIKKIERLALRAREIASGRTWENEVTERGNSEVDDLSKALNQMVIYMQGALDGERRNSRKMQEFIGDASHELRTPLTVIKGYVELLGRPDGLDFEGRTRAMDRLGTEIGRMERLIADLLFLAEIGEKSAALDETVNLSDIVRIQITDLKLLDPHRVVEDSITPDTYLTGSVAHIQQLISNLFSNIRRHTPSDAHVYVYLTKEDSGVRVRVGDGGPGLPVEAYERGVQQFQRFDSSRSRASGGSGLGMSIMQAIVSEHSGEMSFKKSELGGLEVNIFFRHSIRGRE